MKIGFERQDPLAGERYVVSGHLAEHLAANVMEKHFPEATDILVREAFLNSEEPNFSGIASMLTAHSYTIIPWDGTADALGQRARKTILLTAGDMHAMTIDADVLAAAEAENVVHVWWLASPRDAFRLPPVGVREVDLMLVDPSLFDVVAWLDALPYAIRLGILFDKHLFSLVYSTYDPLTLLTRGCRLVENLVREDAGNVRARLAFGAAMEQVIDRIAADELTEAEATALGMLYEVRLGARLGVCNPRKLADLDGVLTFYGYPRAIVATAEELCESFHALYGGRDTLTLTLPTAIGACRTADYDTATLHRLLATFEE